MRQTAVQTYYACQLFYVGCTANADVAAELFGADDALTTYAISEQVRIAGRDDGRLPPRGGAARRHADRARRAARPAAANGRQGLQASHRRVLRGGHDAHRPARRPFRRWAPCSHTSPSVGTARASRAARGRRDTAADADRSRRPRRRLPADARWRRACGSRWFAVARGTRSIPTWSRPSTDDAAGFFAIDAASAWDETLAREPRPRTLPGRRVDRHRPCRHGRLQRSRLAVLRRTLDRRRDVGYERSPTLRFRHARTSRRFGGRRLSTTSGG